MSREHGSNPDEMGMQESKENIYEKGNIRLNTENVANSFQSETAQKIIDAMAPFMDAKVQVQFKKMKPHNPGFNAILNPEFRDDNYRDTISMNPDFEDHTELPGYLLHELGHSFEGKIIETAASDDVEILPPGDDIEADFHADLIPAYILDPDSLKEIKGKKIGEQTLAIIKKIFKGEDFSGLRKDLHEITSKYKEDQGKEFKEKQAEGNLDQKQLDTLRPPWLAKDYSNKPFFHRVFKQVNEY